MVCVIVVLGCSVVRVLDGLLCDLWLCGVYTVLLVCIGSLGGLVYVYVVWCSDCIVGLWVLGLVVVWAGACVVVLVLVLVVVCAICGCMGIVGCW